MKKQTLFAVAVFALLLVAGIMTVGRDRARGVSRVDLSSASLEGVDEIVLSGAHQAQLKRESGTETWSVDGRPADQRAVKQLLEAVPKISSSDLVTRSESRWADFEVDAEKGTTVELKAAGRTVVSFVVGKAASGGVHVRHGDEVYAISGVYPRTFAKGGADWLEKRLFGDLKVNDAEKVEVALHGKDPYTLVKKDGSWALEDPSVLPAGFRFDPAAAGRVASSLVGLRAKEILTEDPGADTTGLAEGYDVLTFTMKAEGDAPAVTGAVHLGKTNEAEKVVYARVVGRDDVVTVYESSVSNLRKEPRDLRDLKMMDFEQAKVRELTVVSDGKTLVLEKKGNDWAVGRSSQPVPDDFSLDSAAVTRRLSALQNARAQELARVSAAAAGLGRPTATVTVTLEDGSKVSLRFGKEEKVDGRDVVYASGNADDAVYVTNAYTRKNLTGLLDTFRKREGGAGGGLSHLDPKALQNLPPDVRRSLEQQLKQQQQQQQMIDRLQKQMAATE